MPDPHLLLIEDDLTLGELLVTVLKRAGHEVTWFVRARWAVAPAVGLSRASVENPGVKLVLMDADGKESVCVPPLKYELALVDYRLKGSPIDGPDVTPYLVACGLPVVGISGLPTLNDDMIRAGARGGIAKDQLMSKVLSRELVIDSTFAGIRA